ncbi:MAG: ATP synthase F1 subunit delta [Candidatus Aminicenantes bacterium]|nr:ATP synthase F1 subunit delta [Candidatus Aminicenantes bacterium]
MKVSTLVKRYAHGLVAACSEEAEYESILTELKEINRLFESHRELKFLLENPFIPRTKKKRIVEEIIDSLKPHPKVKRFLHLINDHERLPLLKDIVNYFPYAWLAKKGVAVFEVRSAVPLEKEEVEAIGDKLTRLEAGPVYLDLIVDPEILAGLRIRKGNVVYDASIKGQLNKIKEILSEE